MAKMPDQVYAVCRSERERCDLHRLERLHPVEVLTNQQEAISRLYYYRGMMPEDAFVLLEVKPELCFTLIQPPVYLGEQPTITRIESTAAVVCPKSVWALMAACSALAFIELEGELFADDSTEQNLPSGDGPGGR
jgi:hypothetical protein